MMSPKLTVLISFVCGGGLLLVACIHIQKINLTGSVQTNASAIDLSQSQTSASSEFGTRYQLTYGQWVNLLRQEAAVVAQKKPNPLYVLAGDSLSLWFPSALLPEGGTWLNQGISGETTYGLLRRLNVFNDTKPQIIFIMIGINDLIRGVRDETLLANQREIVRYLKAVHPNAQVILQSILPHAGERASQRFLTSVKGDPAPEENPPPLWVKRLPVIPNSHIRRLNQRMSIMAGEEKIVYLDLYDSFADDQGFLKDTYTTDGLHLSKEGYALWRSHIERFVSSNSRVTVSR